MADVNRGARPLSPHLEVYRFEWTMALSIAHRVTGVGLTLGAVLVSFWLLAAGTDAALFARIDGFLTSWLGGLILLGSTAALWYHFANGVRHLWWDMGYGFELAQAKKTGQWAVAAAAALTAYTVLTV
jgi:succinate dehydrogenase / fumarate reductase cytochrome b subunit